MKLQSERVGCNTHQCFKLFQTLIILIEGTNVFSAQFTDPHYSPHLPTLNSLKSFLISKGTPRLIVLIFLFFFSGKMHLLEI